MANDISKTDYLKRYLEKDEKKLKRKKKHKQTNLLVPRLKILDKDIDLKSIKFGGKDIYDEDEEPVVADIIDERPVEVKIKEIYESSRWKKLDSTTGEPNEDSDNILGDIQSHNKGVNVKNNVHKNFISKKETHSVYSKSRHDSDSVSSPQLFEKKAQSRTRWDSDSDTSISNRHPIPVQSRKRHDSDSDASISNRDPIPVQSRKIHDSDSDNSFSRRQRIGKPHNKTSDKKYSSSSRLKGNLHRKSEKFDSDSDLSPERLKNKKHSLLQKNVIQKRVRKDSDSDLSPERRRKSSSSLQNVKSRREINVSDSDISPPREFIALKKREDSAKDHNARPMKTLSGLKAGLQNATTLREETQELRIRERKQINELNSELSGRNANTIVRDRKTGKIRDLEAEDRRKEEKEKRNSDQIKKYSEWGKGIEQTEHKKTKLNEDLYEMSKPLARYCDDDDLEDRLKSIIYDDDPMSAYMKKKRHKEAGSSVPEYNGPPPPPNRFGLKPGYRWDGVDRSNGFEKKYFEKHCNKKAIQEEAYLWSVQNM